MITKGKMSYSYRRHEKLGWMPRLYNYNLWSIDLMMFDVGAGVLYAFHHDKDIDSLIQIDYGHPTREFITAMNDARNDDGRPVVEIVVVEQGIAYAEGEEGEKEEGGMVPVLLLEASPVTDLPEILLSSVVLYTENFVDWDSDEHLR